MINANLFLLPLIGGIIAVIMTGLIGTIGTVSLGAMIPLFITASQPNSHPLYGIAGIICAILALTCFYYVGQRTLSEWSFKKRLGEYIVEGSEIIHNKDAYTTKKFIGMMYSWTNKASQDIGTRRSKGEEIGFKNEINLKSHHEQLESFLKNGDTDDEARLRDMVVGIINQRLTYLGSVRLSLGKIAEEP